MYLSMDTPIPNPTHPDTIEGQDSMAFVDYRYLSSLGQESDITGHFLFDGDAHEQPGDVQFLDIPSVGGPHTSSIVTDPLPQPPVRPPVIHMPDVGDHLALAVGSLQIQQAVGKRRKKDAIYDCPWCFATFTARHNLRYHVNAHLDLKPYKCGKCAYAASSPATTKRHQSTCKAERSSAWV